MPAPDAAHLRDKWNAFGAAFDRLPSRATAVIGHALATYIMRPDTPMHVLDVGCGNGNTAEIILMLYPQARVTCVDLSDAMIELARRKLAARFGERVTFHQCDVENMQAVVPDASVDVVVGSLVIHMLPHPDALLREVMRVLVPGGRVALSGWGRREFGVQFSIKMRAMQELGLMVPATTSERSGFDFASDLARVQALFAASGLVGFVSWYHFAPMAGVSAAEYARFVTYDMHDANIPLSDEQRPQLCERVEKLAAEHLLAKGTPIGFEALMMGADKPRA